MVSSGKASLFARRHMNVLRPFQRTTSCTSCCLINNNFTQRAHYGTKVKIERDTAPAPSLLSPYLRTCLTDGLPQNNNEFCISFLGTSSGSSTMHRNASCTALRLGGKTYIFDCAEGTTRQLIHSRIALSSITKIFISHLHGDHVYGLIPIILEVQVAVKLMKQAYESRKPRSSSSSSPHKQKFKHEVVDDKPTLEIYGPPGLYNYICFNLALSLVKMNYLNVIVTELVGGTQERGMVNIYGGAGMGNGRRGRRNVYLSHYPEVEIGLLTRKYLEVNKDEGTWTISSPPPIDENHITEQLQQQQQRNSFKELPNDVNISNRQLYIKAAELDHLKGVQTFGYTVQEQTPPGTIDPKKAIALGLQPSKKYSLLKCGIPVSNDDGTAMIDPKDVLIETFRARKLSFLADHRRVPPPMKQLCKDSDVLIHEATLSVKDGADKIKIRGHNTAYNAGVAGRVTRSKVVVLNHFASVVRDVNDAGEVVKEAESGNDGVSQIVASYDFMELCVPRGGFQFDETEGEMNKDRSSQKEDDNDSLLSLLAN